MLNVDLSNARTHDYVYIVLAIFCLFLPGYWFVFQFAPKMFLKPDFLSFLLLSIAISFPVFLLNQLISLDVLQTIVLNPKEDREVNGKINTVSIYFGSLSTIVVFYMPCIISFIHKLSLKQAISIAIGTQVIVFLLSKGMKSFGPNNKITP